MGMPAESFSINRGLHGPEINKRAITAMTAKAAIIGQLVLFISTSPPLNRHSNRPRRTRFLICQRSNRTADGAAKYQRGGSGAMRQRIRINGENQWT